MAAKLYVYVICVLSPIQGLAHSKCTAEAAVSKERGSYQRQFPSTNTRGHRAGV